jgi:hypothetical protein
MAGGMVAFDQGDGAPARLPERRRTGCDDDRGRIELRLTDPRGVDNPAVSVDHPRQFASAEPAAPGHEGPRMIDLYLTSTNQLIGSITEAELQVLTDALEEESTKDQDYYISAATIDVIGDGRATVHLLGLLRSALGSNDGVDIRWQRR